MVREITFLASLADQVEDIACFDDWCVLSLRGALAHLRQPFLL